MEMYKICTLMNPIDVDLNCALITCPSPLKPEDVMSVISFEFLMWKSCNEFEIKPDFCHYATFPIFFLTHFNLNLLLYYI